MYAQYLILLKVFIEVSLNNLSLAIYPSNLNALYSATKKAIDNAYPYKMNGSK